MACGLLNLPKEIVENIVSRIDYLVPLACSCKELSHSCHAFGTRTSWEDTILHMNKQPHLCLDYHHAVHVQAGVDYVIPRWGDVLYEIFVIDLVHCLDYGQKEYGRMTTFCNFETITNQTGPLAVEFNLLADPYQVGILRIVSAPCEFTRIILKYKLCPLPERSRLSCSKGNCPFFRYPPTLTNQQ